MRLILARILIAALVASCSIGAEGPEASTFRTEAPIAAPDSSHTIG
jgi:hypothetical protein